MDGVRLIIAELGVDVPVVGVPTDETGWDLAWLGNRAGYLYGTAYPTVAGNSAVTAHVYLPNGRPGPFVRLSQLAWDDEIIVVVNGLEHIYRVRQVLRVAPEDLSVLRHEDYPWLTLITCQGFDESGDVYRWRVAVRAVLVEIRSP
jgi:LPXTG-site transpeptidase (sortase) family protein